MPKTKKVKNTSNGAKLQRRFVSRVSGRGAYGMRVLGGRGSFWDKIKKGLSYVPRIGSSALGAVKGGVPGAIAGWHSGAELSKSIGLGRYRTRGRGAYAFGSRPAGDYVPSDVLASPVPAMHSASESVNLCKVEYLGELVTSATPYAFAITALQFNPGVFLYWGSKFAGLFQQWKLNGAMVYFKSHSSSYTSTVSLGKVLMCMNYNPHANAYADQQEMQESTGCVSCAIDQNAGLGIEAAKAATLAPVKYVRTGPTPSGEDVHLYDAGKLQVATVGCPTASANVGSIWISYDITYYKPITQAGRISEGASYELVSATSAAMAGTSQTKGWDTLGLTISGTSTLIVTLPAGTMGRYVFSYYARSGAATDALTTFSMSYTNAVAYAPVIWGGSSYRAAPENAIQSYNKMVSQAFTITDPSLATVIVFSPTWAGSYTFSNSTVTIFELPRAAMLSSIVPDRALVAPSAHLDTTVPIREPDEEDELRPAAAAAAAAVYPPPNQPVAPAVRRK